MHLSRVNLFRLACLVGILIYSGFAAAQDLEVVASGAAAAPPRANSDTTELPADILLRDFLVLPRVGNYGRQPLQRDPIDYAMASGSWKPPSAGDTVTAADGQEHSWQVAQPDQQGRLSGPHAQGGYAHTVVSSPVERIMLLKATRHASVRVGNEWLAGDPYGLGWLELPVRLGAGEMPLLFHLAQPGFNAKLVTPPADVYILTADVTLPDVAIGEDRKQWGAVPIVNATTQRLTGGEIRATCGEKVVTTKLPAIESLTVFKAAFRFDPTGGSERDQTVKLSIFLRDTRGGDGMAEVTTQQLPVRRVADTEPHVRTFISQVDDSVQSYYVVPATEPATRDETGLILALHGLGESHEAFAKNYQAKPWAHIVLPQNRRPFGFDWEDWGATDAMQALRDARRHLLFDRRRTYLTGHSMGGRGAWYLATRYPDRFAAVGISSGWIAGGSPDAAQQSSSNIETLLGQLQSVDATLPLLRNLTNMGVYILHGEQDQRISPAQSRYMRGRLGNFHKDFVYYERPGAGHWWGKECVDWPDMMQFFKSRRLDDDPDELSFSTHNPALSSECHWATIGAQEDPLEVSNVTLKRDKKRNVIRGRTRNCRIVAFETSSERSDRRALKVTLDNSPTISLRPRRRGQKLWLAKDEEGRWQQSREPTTSEKTADRAGMFKAALDHRFVLVYGTAGNQEENDWARQKARYDAQTFWYRGNGAAVVMPDAEFDASGQPNRSVILYGNAQTNTAWPALLSTCPVQVRSGRLEVSVEISARPEIGDDLGLLMVRPHPGSTSAHVGVVGGTGVRGMRATDRLRYFVSGVTYPDLMIFGPAAFRPSTGKQPRGDIRTLGTFGPNWNVDTGNIVWRDLAL